MAGKRHDQGRVCGCDRPDGSCAGLVVRRLSRDRVRELAEEIWAASSGLLLPVRADGDPRSSRPGASARAAYLRRREQERAVWRPGQAWRWWTGGGAALTVGLVVGATLGERLGWSAAVVAAVLAWSRLRCRPSPQAVLWRRQAALQRRTAGLLQPLEQEGYLVLHDLTLPGWPASLEHLVVGPTGVWVVESWRRRRLLPGGGAPPATLRGLRGQTGAVAEGLDGPRPGPGPGAAVRARPLAGQHPVIPRRPDRGPTPARQARPLRATPSGRPAPAGHHPRPPTPTTSHLNTAEPRRT